MKYYQLTNTKKPVSCRVYYFLIRFANWRLAVGMAKRAKRTRDRYEASQASEAMFLDRAKTYAKLAREADFLNPFKFTK